MTQSDSAIFAERVVHLDLKGAPPRVSYLLELFPLLQKLGTTGLLLEYEDMFPFQDDLAILRCPNAYSESDLAQILNAAKNCHLKVIPLIQTFGHLEFVLKHDKFASCRELPNKFQSICPKHPDSLPLLKKLIDQVVRLHPGCETLHIGADEAYDIAKCRRCKSWFGFFGWAKERLTLSHLLRIAQYVKDKHNLRVLSWNDMFQHSKAKTLAKYRLKQYLEPVVWGYSVDLLARNYFPRKLFQTLAKAFDQIWVASAFKGANWNDQAFIDIDRYLQNHSSWFTLLDTMKNIDRTKTVAGIILTGWQRFEHFAPLCELLPVSIPSLAVCLVAVRRGAVDESVYHEAVQLADATAVCGGKDQKLQKIENKNDPAGCEILRSTHTVWADCRFPGSDLYQLSERLKKLRDEFNQASKDGVQANESFGLIGSLIQLGQEFRRVLEKYYFEDTVNEWLHQNIQVFIEHIRNSEVEVKVKKRPDCGSLNRSCMDV